MQKLGGSSFRSLARVCAFALIAACSENAATPSAGDGGPPPVGTGSHDDVRGLPCAVDEVLARNCRSCHSNPPVFGAPMPLVTWDDLHAPAPDDRSKKVYERVIARIHDRANPMPKAPNPRLGLADTKVLDDFAGAGAPRSGTRCSAQDASGAPVPLDCEPDLHMVPGGRWTMPKNTEDQYVCYGFEIPQPAKRHITAFAPKIDNKKLVHHVVLFQSDRAEDPTPHACSGGGSIFWRMIFAWAPGGQNLNLPPEAGFPLEGTTHYVAQIHYNNVTRLEGESDATGFDMCSTSQLRPNDADVMAFGSQRFRIPRQSQLDITCSLTVPDSFPEVHVFSAMPHMHKLGTGMINTLYPARDPARPVDLGTQSSWDFNNQVWMRIDATLRPGDRIKTRCAWTNPTQDEVTFGENTANEMCYAFTMYYPRIETSVWSWSQPASASECKPTGGGVSRVEGTK
ncbi:hypothetical protein [Pendulispora albinea]|uniref:Peptidylglycine alpha-amidating monooxygenase n=1 Tax=Pendulispora albinea TaxID=2741071 RepID=A0ABZ2LKY6_9BACT